ncbi:trans-sulfuration enzyme family protein [Micromonospora sp. LOL_021]|uniref:trans-sulfuration enzyme family protein n=1 Tax=Micromonospora sp. LOL_021 TaxID=3345417 RepID=UPI003A86E509
MRFDTRLVQVGQDPEPGSGDVVPALHLAATYDRTVQDPPRYFYARGENPTRDDLQRSLAALEGARFATVYASGQAAAMTALSLLRPGQRLLCGDDIYGGTYQLLQLLERYGIRVSFADLTDPAVLNRLDGGGDGGADVAMVWVESPSNPLLKVVDLAEIAERTHRIGALLVVDNTLASPALQQPLQWGADVTVYSTTKSIAGHLDVLGGALVYDDPELHEQFLAYRTTTGNMAGALDCFLVHRGLKTLGLRMARQVDNAQRMVEALRDEPSVVRTHYPGLATHPGHALAKRQMAGGGALFSFEYRHDPEKLMSRVRHFTSAVSLGGVRSLIECPALMTHRPIPREERLARGISDNLIRVSPGIEDPADLVADLIAAVRAGDR